MAFTYGSFAYGWEDDGRYEVGFMVSALREALVLGYIEFRTEVLVRR